MNGAKSYQLYQKIVQIKLVENRISYKKLTELACLFLPGVKLEGSKDLFQILQGVAKISSLNHTTCLRVNNAQRCSHCSWLGVSVCNRHSGVMFALYCANTEIEMLSARVKYTKDEHIFLLILHLCNHVDYATILAEFAKHFSN